MKVLITGACGYIGGALSYYLEKNSISFVGIDDLSNSTKKNFSKSGKLYIGNINNKNFLEKILNKFEPTHIIHLAASSDVSQSEKNKKKYLQNNYENSKIIFDLTKKKKITFLFASSAAVYSPSFKAKKEDNDNNDRPFNYYGYTKKKFEKYLLKSKKNEILIFRFFNVVGCTNNFKYGNKKKNKSLFNNLSKSLLENSIFKIYGNNFKTRDGTAVRDYIDINDLCKIIIFFIKRKKIYKTIFNIGTGSFYSVKEIVKLFEANSKKKIKIRKVKAKKGNASQIISDNFKLNKIYKGKFFKIEKSIKNHIKFYKYF